MLKRGDLDRIVVVLVRARNPANIGAVARAMLGSSVVIRGALVQIGPHAIDRANWDWAETERNPFWCPDAETAARWEDYLDAIRKDLSSVGAVVEVHAEGVPAGWGAPIYGKLDAELAAALETAGLPVEWLRAAPT